MRSRVGKAFPSLAPSDQPARYDLGMSEGRTKFTAFISYATRYAPWVERFHADLERCLEEAGAHDRVFFDRKELVSGSSWVDPLERGLEEARHLVLILTPEALASPWVAKEKSSFLASHRAQRPIHVVRLVDCSVPAFLADLQAIDLVDCDDAGYREGLRRLLVGVLGDDARSELTLPADLRAPAPPRTSLPEALRGRWTSALEAALSQRLLRIASEAVLGLDRGSLDLPDPRQAAERALVLATRAEDPRTAALRATKTLIDELGDDLPPETATELRSLRDALDQLETESPEPGLLGAWLAKILHEHQRLVPYFQQQTELDLLDRVYVQLELRHDRLGLARAAEEERHSEPRTADEAARLGGPLSIRQVLDLDPTHHPAISRRWVILGDPGAGKTTLLRHLASELAREAPPRWIPVFESLPRLMREREWFLDRIERHMKRAGHEADGLAAVLSVAGEEGRLLVLLDGLDEVPSDDRGDAEDLLREISRRWPATPILVTSRPIGFRRPGAEFHELELLPFDGERRRQFLARWFGRATGKPDPLRGDRAASDLEADPSLRDLASNPLYLTLMALLIEQGTSPATNRTQLYDQVFDLLLDGKHRPGGRAIDCQAAVREVLRHFAITMTEDNRDGEPVQQLEDRLYRQEIDRARTTLERVSRWRHNLRRFLDDLAEQTGIVGEHDGPGAEWRFWHRTFREALASEELARRHQVQGQQTILDHARSIAGDEGRWAEPYALLTGRVEEPDALVKALVAENSDLGLRALATAQSVDDETIVEVLELSDQWKKRAEVYLTLPDRLDDPVRTLALVDRLRQRTRNGNDLYHLELTTVLVAQRWPDAVRSVDELRGRFYDHIPQPPTELFETVETKDGRVPLWCEIPAGRFLMGSPETEEGRLKNEGPQHEVEVANGFRIAAVPVTQEQYATFDPVHHSRDHGVGLRPVETVSWFEAMAFCRWLATRGDLGKARLPTEEEWEYACRAGSTSRFWSGDSEGGLERVGWCNRVSLRTTQPVGLKQANPWGLYDVHGNVWEWTASPWSDDYSGRGQGCFHDPQKIDSSDMTPQSAGSTISPTDPAGASLAGRVFRGGSYWFESWRARSAYRTTEGPESRGKLLGFRVLLPLASPRS